MAQLTFLSRPAGQTRALAANAAWLVLVAMAGVAVTWFRTRYMLESSALYGFEPTALIDPVWQRPEFAADFPNGEAQTLKSLVGQVYQLLGLLPFSKSAIATAMIFAEFCALAAGAFVCARAVDRSLPVWIGLGTALLLTTGAIISCDLARWFHPYYGSVYNFAYGAGLAGVAAILARRPILGGIAVGLAAAIHPIIALYFGLAMAIAALVRIRDHDIARLAAGGGVAALIAGVWTYLMLGDSGISGGAVDPDLYIALARMMSSHWFPFSLGVFGARSWETLLPFTGFLLLFSILLGGGDEDRNRTDRQVGAAVAALVLLALGGAVVSEYSGIPVLVKLALHRASSVALLLAAIVVIPRLLAAAVSGSLPRSALALLLLLTPFWYNHGLPIVACIAFALVVLFERRKEAGRWWRVATLAATAIPIGVALFAGGPSLLVFGGWYFGTGALALTALAVAAAARLVRQPALLAIALACGVATWVPGLQNPKGAELERARAYLEVQQWARANTPPDALFMTDPGHAYGWREHSQRPSFGTLREWLYSGWIYDTQAEAMREGLERTKALGIDVDAYLHLDMPEHGTGYREMFLEAERLYHSGEVAWFGAMAERYGIDYFVLDKTQAISLPSLPVAFQNRRYAVLSPPAD